MDEKTIAQYREEMMQMYRRRRSAGESDITPAEEPAASAVSTDEMTGQGKVIVAVTSGMGNIPIKGAGVTVRKAGEEDGEVLRTVTDESGKTGMMLLPAPARRYSMTPADSQTAVFALYDIEARAQGYITSTVRNVPIFDGVVSIQSMPLLWLPASGGMDGMDGMQTENEGNPYRL